MLFVVPFGGLGAALDATIGRAAGRSRQPRPAPGRDARGRGSGSRAWASPCRHSSSRHDRLRRRPAGRCDDVAAARPAQGQPSELDACDRRRRDASRASDSVSTCRPRLLLEVLTSRHPVPSSAEATHAAGRQTAQMICTEPMPDRRQAADQSRPLSLGQHHPQTDLQTDPVSRSRCGSVCVHCRQSCTTRTLICRPILSGDHAADRVCRCRWPRVRRAPKWPRCA